MSEPLGYFLTWTTYGTWLPGDRRGWVDGRHRGDSIVQEPRPSLEAYAKKLLAESEARLNTGQRNLADEVIRQTCTEHQWCLHALSVRSNHVHLVVTARDAAPGKVMGVLKSQATRTMNNFPDDERRSRWWTEGGSKRILNSQESLEAAIRYVLGQDTSWKRHR